MTAADGTTGAGARPVPASRRRGIHGAALTALGVVVGLAAGLLLTSALLRPGVPAEGSAEAGFARDMQAHHAQAVEMSVLVRERSQDPQVRQLALDILLTQQQQQGQMFGWLAVWGLPPTGPGAPMAWMGGPHGHGDVDQGLEAMPGWVGPEDMGRLRDADGAEADRLYLALMIPHHEGGVEMARAVLARTDDGAVRRLAEAVVASQQAEITVLDRMLSERGGAPRP